jgi:hypothetical protein
MYEARRRFIILYRLWAFAVSLRDNSFKNSRRLPAAEVGFNALRRSQRDVISPGAGHDLNADGQSFVRRTCAHHYSRPAGQTVRHGMA